MKLTKIQKILKFKQSDWLKKYIGFNTEKRKNVANSFEKDFLKLMMKSAYGKTIKVWEKESMLVNNEKDYKPTFISQNIFDKPFAAIHEINQF